MSAAPATATAAPDGAASKGGKKKKLIVIIGVAVALLLAGGGGAAFFIMKKKAAEAAAAAAAEESDDSGDGEHADKPAKAEPEAHGKGEHGAAPTFVPLDPFTVNLTDKDADRFAQIGLSLQVNDPHLGDELKNYMPAIRNAILLLLSHKSSDDLLSQEGKARLAQEIRRDAARAMGYVVEDPFAEEAARAASGAASGGEAPRKKKKKKKSSFADNPIVQVNYATFIVQ